MSLPATSPLLVCLPGALLDPAQFALQRDALEPAIEVHALDYAALTTAGGAAFSIEAAAEHVVDRIASEPAHRHVALCGHSLGGMVALLAAARLGGRLAGLMLLETSYGPATDGWARWLVPPVDVVIAATPWFMMRHAIIHEPGRLSTSARDYLRVALPHEQPARSREIVRSALRFDGRNALSTVRVPTLVVVGERNRWTHAQARTMVQGIPDAKLRIVPNAGHMVSHDAAREVNGIIDELLT